MSSLADSLSSAEVAPAGHDTASAPPLGLDAYLDATARCFARLGVRRTSVQDIARELGVSRATIYRRLGTVDDAAGLLVAREFRRCIESVDPLIVGPVGPDEVVEIVATMIEWCWNHPVAATLVRDEPDVLSQRISDALPALVATATVLAEPVFAGGIAAGRLRPLDASVLAEWIVRIGVSLFLVPSALDVRTFLRTILAPALTPDPQGAP